MQYSIMNNDIYYMTLIICIYIQNAPIYNTSGHNNSKLFEDYCLIKSNEDRGVDRKFDIILPLTTALVIHNKLFMFSIWSLLSLRYSLSNVYYNALKMVKISLTLLLPRFLESGWGLWLFWLTNYRGSELCQLAASTSCFLQHSFGTP